MRHDGAAKARTGDRKLIAPRGWRMPVSIIKSKIGICGRHLRRASRNDVVGSGREAIALSWPSKRLRERRREIGRKWRAKGVARERATGDILLRRLTYDDVPLGAVTIVCDKRSCYCGNDGVERRAASALAMTFSITLAKAHRAGCVAANSRCIDAAARARAHARLIDHHARHGLRSASSASM